MNVEKYIENRKLIKQLEEENEAIKVEIKLEMAEKEVNDLSNNEYVVLKKTFKRISFDNEKIKSFIEATGGKLEEFQKRFL